MKTIHIALDDKNISDLALLSDVEEDHEQLEAFNRISGLLSELIQEANEAVHNQESLGRSANSTMGKKTCKESRRTRKTKYSRKFLRSSSLSPTPSPSTSYSSKKSAKHRPRACSAASQDISKRIECTQNPLVESFKRLDDSIAQVNTLSRDLAKENKNKIHDLNLLLLMPLIHAPRTFFTALYNYCKLSQLFEFSTMILFACMFTVTHFVVDQVAVIKPELWLPNKTKHAVLPGSF